MERDKRHISRQKQNILINMVPAWERGEVTLYRVAKESGVDWGTCKKLMPRYAAQLKAKEQEIMQKLVTPEENVSIWARIKAKILGSIITEP